MYPILCHENNFVTDFREKTEIFYHFFFAKHCSLTNSDSSLPSEIIKKKNNSISQDVGFSTKDILKVINNLDFNKAHGHELRLVLEC